MRPRLHLLELFSSFAQFEADVFRAWVSDARLQRNMKQCLAEDNLTDPPEAWALYWHQQWRQAHPLARLHLVAYLQEACYHAARKMAFRFTLQQYGLADCFQLAIAEVDKVLTGFRPERSSALEAFARITFTSTIINTLRCRREIDICTDWLLLRKLSRKQLLEALDQAGLDELTIAQYRLAWLCFKQVYGPIQSAGTQKLPTPDATLWGAIAERYNQERLHQLSPPGSACDAKTIEQWLLSCAQKARAYLYPAVGSLNVPRPGSLSGEIQDDLVGPGKPSLVDAAIAHQEAQERQQQQVQVNQVLTEAIACLKPEEQSLMQLYYGQNLTQQQIAEQLAMQQYTVSRRLSKVRKTLLSALAAWGQRLGIQPTSDSLTHMSLILEEWLQEHYSPLVPDRSSPLA
jgi:RNA polymerase sigma factor (sigma-70 family)